MDGYQAAIFSVCDFSHSSIRDAPLPPSHWDPQGRVCASLSSWRHYPPLLVSALCPPHPSLFHWLSFGPSGSGAVCLLLAITEQRRPRHTQKELPGGQKGKPGKRSALQSVAFLAFLKVAKMWLCLSKLKQKNQWYLPQMILLLRLLEPELVDK